MGKIKTNRINKNKDLEESKKYIKRRNDIITYRLFILFGITVALVSFFVFIMNAGNTDIKTLSAISFAGLIVTGILFILSGLFFFYRLIKGIDESGMTVNSKNIFAVSLFAFLADSLIFFTGQNWIPFLTALVIAVTILVYLYYLYQKEFFLFALFTAICCFLLYFTETSLLSGSFKTGFRVLLAAAAIFVLAFSLILKKNKGRLNIGPFNIRILRKDAKYFQFFILAAFIAVCAVLGLITISLLSFLNFFYMICAVLGCFIIVGIYFTVKMI